MTKLNRAEYSLIDLHLHLDGSLSCGTVRELAAMQGLELPRNDDALLNRLRVAPGCRNLNDYLDRFPFPVSLLQTENALRTAAYRLACELKQQKLLYAEIRFAPQLHQQKGLKQQAVVDAVLAGLRQADFPSGLILCCIRGSDNFSQNLETVDLVAEYLGKGVCALDLAGAEAIYPTQAFADVFRRAYAKNIPCTIHAGEADGPDSIRAALNFGAKRIGHGVRCTEDPELMRRLASDGIVLELCPTSNLHTCIFDRLEDYPLRRLMDAGISVTVNTDNMTVSDTTVAREMQQLTDALGLTEEERRQLAINSAAGSFTDAAAKQMLLKTMINIKQGE